MSLLILTKEEQTLLTEVLEVDLKIIQSDLSRANHWELKRELREKENVIKNALSRLESQEIEVRP